ncbi:MAG TPA: hypothetical protein VFJ58_09305 [Armatimonadota bacterium]|nr:hypothetical protein [Armatimonadota bacterium]
MPFGPGFLVSVTCLGGYVYWRFSFRQVTAAIEMDRAGRTDEARALLHRFLGSRNPLVRRGEPRARLLLARLERKAGRYAEAVKAADALLALPYPRGITVPALQVRADALAWAGDLDGALESAEQALVLAEQSRGGAAETEWMLVRILTWRGEMDRARERADRLSQEPAPTRWYGLLRLAEIERLAGDSGAAAEQCRQLIESVNAAGDSARGAPLRRGFVGLAHFHAARAAWQAGDQALATEWLDFPAADLLPASERVSWWGLQAAAAADRGEMDTANGHLNAMRAAMKVAPAGYGTRAWSSYYTARVEMAAGRFEAAADGLTEAIRNDPPREALAEMFFCLGLCLEQTGSPGAAGAFACGARQPAAFYYARLCRDRAAAREECASV